MSGDELTNSIISAWNPAVTFVVRPLFAIAFVFSFIALSWFVAWKTVLVHVPVVQEIFGLRKKQFKPKPLTRGRVAKFYSSQSSSRLVAERQNPASAKIELKMYSDGQSE